MSLLLQQIKEKAQLKKKTIVLCEGTEPRTLKAAKIIASEGIASLIMLGDESTIEAELGTQNDVKIIDPKKGDPALTELLYELRKSKGMTKEQAEQLCKDPLYYGTLLVKSGQADGMVAGAINTTGNVLKPALQIVKTAPNINTVSSSIIMVLPNGSKYGENGVMIFGDCAVMPDPTAEQLASIAISSAQTAQVLAGITPKVAMLSFSTKGSGKHANVDKVREATELVKAQAPDLSVDGELQVDAAIEAEVAALKAPNSTVAGKANVFIFPDLQSGNIGYKLVQRLAGAEAIGPICQGLAKPINDLSRGCSVDDIVSVVAITAVQAQNK